eukprot:NODE_3177_length_932_cov_8.227329_g3156_i0.p1 GENE.NODE_3177_length_932_cov_8.227329_g3156_i0~~NODE_3177_length_932_cov_8.227329_g3156_i0.p1  ORF type:complete len:132 (+),score=7.87 NODE_3177_length_932_cov_8.227329_g3156_i0:186-581(+)
MVSACNHRVHPRFPETDLLWKVAKFKVPGLQPTRPGSWWLLPNCLLPIFGAVIVVVWLSATYLSTAWPNLVGSIFVRSPTTATVVHRAHTPAQGSSVPGSSLHYYPTPRLRAHHLYDESATGLPTCVCGFT